ncbi:MAG: riboflavin biosynthesis protein RibF [Synergistaceae bacterium]|nr:riboflavin biosynthesis protein RibF [Synergistaceae bacterium]
MLITVGAFDGFHRGHAQLLRVCRENSRPNDWGVVTFHPHPSAFIGRMRQSLFTLQERAIIRKILGIPQMFVLRFNDALMNLTPEKFWQLIRRRFNVDGLVMGSDFHFGRQRSGNAEYLEKLAKADGLTKIFTVPLMDKQLYSSSNVRKNILTGNVNDAAKILGYPFFVVSKIIHGDMRGRLMSFPTANLEIKNNRVFPPYGVYSCGVYVSSSKNKWYCGALSIGNNPTFGDVHETRAEVNILDFDGDLYGSEILVMFLEKVRNIMTFSDKNELISQIEHDIQKCREIYDRAMRDNETLRFAVRVSERAYDLVNSKVMPEVTDLLLGR